MFKAIKPRDNDDEDLVFTNGWRIRTSHSPDCCEHNYADWSSLDDTGFFEEEFYENDFKLEKWDGGFRINGYTVNCYSEQSGYYSTELEVDLMDDEGTALWFEKIACEAG